jgi:hypothetical protein
MPLPDPSNRETLEYKTFSRGSGDIIETLYADLVKESAELLKLEKEIESIGNVISDSTDAYQRFDLVNERFFVSLEDHTNTIKDSSLHRQIRQLADECKERYELKVATHEQLMKTIEAKQQYIADLKQAIMVTLTIPKIQEYQDKNLPNPRPLQQVIDQIEKVRKETQAVYKRSGG